ncbi:MAG: alpha/beta fold hydrolase [Polyangiales bacterium]
MLNVVDRGGGPAVMLLHGAPSAISDYAGLVESLAVDHRVVVPELPGYGKSPMLDGEYSFARVYALLEDMLLARGIREVAVVGFSLGAHHALAVASVWRRVRVSSVISLAGFAMLEATDRDAIVGFVGALSQPGAQLQTPEMREMVRGRFLAPAYQTDAHAAQVALWLDATTAPVLAAELAAEVRADLREQLQELTMPVLAYVGALDVAVPAAYSREIADLAPLGRVEVVPGNGHALLVEQPAETIAVIRRALAR